MTSLSSKHFAAGAGLAAMALVLWAAAPGAAAGAADAAQGEKLARRWCASCHIVAPDQARGADDAPAFATVAKRPGFSEEKVARFLMDPHPKMPDMQLSRARPGTSPPISPARPGRSGVSRKASRPCG